VLVGGSSWTPGRPMQTRRRGTNESLAALQRQLNQARQDLLDAYEHARAARYRPGSAELAGLEDAERRYQHTRSLWQDRNRRNAGPARRGAAEPDGNSIP